MGTRIGIGAGCVLMFIVGLISCSPTQPLYQLKFAGQTLTVPVTMFDQSNVTIVRDNQARYDILLVKRTPTAFEGLYLKCSYKEHPLVLSGDSINCSAHGCVFNFEGAVRRGPATEPLIKFPADYDGTNGNVRIDISALGL